MCDPTLNACLSLCALRDAILMHDVDNPVPGWLSDYAAAVQNMKTNKRLADLFGSTVMNSLAEIVQHYPQVEQRNISLTEVTQ